MKQGSANATLLVLGQGLAPNTLATVLNGILVSREEDDTGWRWPRRHSAKVFSLVLVASAGASASQIVRWHGEARSCPWINDARLVIVCLDELLSRELPARDIFGRSGQSKDTFADWKNYIAICSMTDGLAGILDCLAPLKPLPSDTWMGRKERASIVPELMRVLAAENTAELKGLVSKLHLQDWDAFCSHEYANHVKRWLASVTDGVAPSWEEGKALFAPFTKAR